MSTKKKITSASRVAKITTSGSGTRFSHPFDILGSDQGSEIIESFAPECGPSPLENTSSSLMSRPSSSVGLEGSLSSDADD